MRVGPQWHADGSFERRVFSHVLFHAQAVPRVGGGTEMSHLAAAFDALPAAQREAAGPRERYRAPRALCRARSRPSVGVEPAGDCQRLLRRRPPARPPPPSHRPQDALRPPPPDGPPPQREREKGARA